MAWRDFLRQELAALKPYEPETQRGESALDANESPYAPPAAYREGLDSLLFALELNRYPDPSCSGLIKAAAAYYQVPPDCLLPGNGSDELIALLLTAFGGPGKRCLVATPTFSMYALCAKAAGWQVLEEPLGQRFELTPAFVARAREEKPALIFLASPNNPTGNAMNGRLISELLALPSVLVLDEAYAEFCPSPAEGPSGDNLIRLRTLSKAFGMAALRVGFLIGPKDLVAELNKVRLPYNIDSLAQTLAARALSMHQAFAAAREKVMADKPRLEAGLKALRGAEIFDSDANFFLFRHPQAESLHQHLLKAKLRLRRFSGGRLNNCLRITVGSTAEVDRCLKAFEEFKP